MICFSHFCNQERFWRIPAKINVSQLRSAAESLSPRDEEPKGDKEQNSFLAQTKENQEEQVDEEKEEVPSERRAQALTALLLTRKKKQHTSEQTGMCGSFLFSSQVTEVNYSSVSLWRVKLHGAHEMNLKMLVVAKQLRI